MVVYQANVEVAFFHEIWLPIRPVWSAANHATAKNCPEILRHAKSTQLAEVI